MSDLDGRLLCLQLSLCQTWMADCLVCNSVCVRLGMADCLVCNSVCVRLGIADCLVCNSACVRLGMADCLGYVSALSVSVNSANLPGPEDFATYCISFC